MSVIFTSAEDAEQAFYEAIGRGDLDALMSVWADDEEIVCIHPTGQYLRGPLAIRDSWRSIFASNSRLTVHVKRSVCWKGLLIAVHSVVETLYLGDEPTPHGPMLSTNVFQRGANGWRLLSHHASASADPGSAETGSAPQAAPLRTLH
ncbi:MAG: nuclear transport factor 2 family protein [Propionivibrio sp.]|uniref:YybH family protein n=1 Tax=Propionivibrio sp. TaxID=2212460 RepID=UPI001A50C684|nr:nuclear transport factor 2 family protein [Propionivibrio sp.]MBL8414112.1 nuclear transport factor 2 family protein [Propionivibrio sp.]